MAVKPKHPVHRPPEPDVTPPERPKARKSDYDPDMGVPVAVAAEINEAAHRKVNPVCPTCGSAFDGKRCSVDGYEVKT
jgi:hypothetical protein